VKFVEELDIPELNSEQIEELCSIAEETARKYVLSHVPLKRIDTLDISAEAEGTKPLKLTVNVDITLVPSMENSDLQKLVDEAVKEAFTSGEKYLRELRCHSQK
jgi:hypothetical protein